MYLGLYLLIITSLASHGNTNLGVSVSTNEIELSTDSTQCDRAGVCPKIECGTSEIKVTLHVNELRGLNVDIENIHMLDRGCRGFRSIDGDLSITMSRGEGVCGTRLTTTGTHATYKNTVFLPPDPAAIIVREIHNINVVCTYSLEQISVSELSQENGRK